MSQTPPVFDPAFQDKLHDLIEWRRDVRRFKTDPVEAEAVRRLIGIAALSPSVGHSQPWRFVMVDDPTHRAAVRENFSAQNAEALAAYHGERARLYATLKLSGLDRAPVQMAVFCDTAPREGYGLGCQTMPEALHYSVAGAVQTLQLAARAEGVGVGVVTILDAEAVHRALDVPAAWRLIAYLCIGYPEEEHIDPELVRFGWQDRLPLDQVIFQR